MNMLLKRLSTLFTILIGVAILFVLGSLLPIEGTYTLRVVLSGSMEPAIQTGSVVATIPRDEYEVGDVVTYRGARAGDMPTTHRIIEVTEVGGGLKFTTKGDANDDEDYLQMSEGDMLGEVFLTIPYAGYAVNALSSTNGKALLVAVIAVLLASAVASRKSTRATVQVKKQKETHEE